MSHRELGDIDSPNTSRGSVDVLRSILLVDDGDTAELEAALSKYHYPKQQGSRLSETKNTVPFWLKEKYSNEHDEAGKIRR